MNDPTYNREEIDANPHWKLAFVLSELGNDSAPLGWGEYIPAARAINLCKPEVAKMILGDTDG